MQRGRKAREVEMQSCRHFAVAVALLLCSIAAASAAGTGPFLVASDDLVLTGAQEHLMWQRLMWRNIGIATAPAASTAAVGATAPAAVELRALPATVTRQLPQMKPYTYATLGKPLLIINPTDRVIVDVITD